MSLARITMEAERLRRGFEFYKATVAPGSYFSRFPDNCCDSTTLICLLHFSRCGFSDLHHLRAEVSKNVKHVWLRIGEVTVDLTADQFGQLPVVVSLNSPWHHGLQPKHLPLDPAWLSRIEGGNFPEYLTSVLELAAS